jgi:hypothetical protein
VTATIDDDNATEGVRERVANAVDCIETRDGNLASSRRLLLGPL